MVGRRLASGGRIDRGRPHLGPDGSGEPTFPGDSPTAVFLAAGRMVADTSDPGRPRGVVRDGQIAGPTLGVDRPAVEPRADCDVLIVGAGPTGLAAALTAARTGLQVILVDRGSGPGGAMLSDEEVRWAQETATELTDLGAQLVFTAEVDQLSPADEQAEAAGMTVSVRRDPGSRYPVTAGRVVLATGAVERPVLFPGNGTPGVMPAEAVRAFLLRYGVLTGEQVVLLAAHDDAYRVAGDLLAVGASVAVIDPRADPDGGPDARFPDRPGPADLLPTGSVLFGTTVDGVTTDDAGVLTGVRLRAADGSRRTVLADLLAVSGGWNPDLALFAASGGPVAFHPGRGAYLPESDLDRLQVAGSARGLRTSTECVADGAGAGALRGLSGELVVLPPPADLEPLRSAPAVLALSSASDPTDRSAILLDPAVDRTVEDVLRTSPTVSTGTGHSPASEAEVITRVLAAVLGGLPVDAAPDGSAGPDGEH